MEPTPVQRAALSQLAAVPGVVGSLTFARSGAVGFSEFPPVCDQGGLRELAARLAGDAYFQEWLAADQAALDLQFGDGRVVVRALDDSWLLVLCTPQVNAQLLSMSLTQVLRRLRLGAEQARPHAHQPPPAAAAPEPSVTERLRSLVGVELGGQAGQALEILAAAGDSTAGLRRAAAEIEQLTRLFISKKKAEELGKRMAGILALLPQEPPPRRGS